MADFRKVLGPFGREIVKSGDTRITWGFIGILADYETAHWTLTYSVEHRNFYVRRSEPMMIPTQHKMRMLLVAGGINPNPQVPVHKDMFIKGDNRVIASGTITNVLRSRLSPEDAALCARLSMNGTSS